jgi:hypothetical protein
MATATAVEDKQTFPNRSHSPLSRDFKYAPRANWRFIVKTSL